MLLGYAYWRFWQMRGHLREGRARLDTILAMPGARDDAAARACGLEAAGGVAYWQGDMEAAGVYYEENLALARDTGDPHQIANALYNASFPFQITMLDIPRAQTLLEEAVPIYRRLDDERGYAQCLWALGQTYFRGNATEKAIEPLEQAIAIFRRLGDRFGLGWALYVRAILALRLYDTQTAKRDDLEALRIFAEAEDVTAPVLILAGLAAVARDEGDNVRAARLAGAAEGQEAATGAGLGSLISGREGWLAPEHPSVEEEAAIAEGRAMTLQQAIDYALSADADEHHLVGRV